ncbi:hypothetical protein PO903_06955 [Paenibacillus sp. PK4536]|uniref:hypothetical protein n=1 Tax=Paenibacillus sp. PK4536 TaxID=3024576 RepID=UPI00235986D3|nr:hypothetical protein [Paenibacillus sp. PK4536]WIM40605.1 hypothetical protein PO903_06955 [Paenibacillus sp. PK4536]
MNKHNTTPIHKIRKIALSALLISSLTLSFASTTWAGASKIYEYDINGRLSTTYTTTEKTTFTYDANGNLLRKHVEKGDYSSQINPQAPVVTPAPTPTPVPQPEPTPPTPVPVFDPSVTPPPVPVPTQSNLGVIYQFDQASYDNQSRFIHIHGWYLDPVGIAKVEIYINGKYAGLARMGESREDVYQVYSSYNNHTAGFAKDQIPLIGEGTQYRKKNNKKNRWEDVPGLFQHTVRLVISNRNGIKSELNEILIINTIS